MESCYHPTVALKTPGVGHIWAFYINQVWPLLLYREEIGERRSLKREAQIDTSTEEEMVCTKGAGIGKLGFLEYWEDGRKEDSWNSG